MAARTHFFAKNTDMMYCAKCKREMKKKSKRKPAVIPEPGPEQVFRAHRTIMEQYMEHAREHPEIILNLILF